MQIIEFIQSIFNFIDDTILGLISSLGNFAYVLMFLTIFIETGLVVAAFLPGDLILFVSGGLSASGHFNPFFCVIILISATVLGDSLNFLIGKKFGINLFKNPNAKFLKKEYLEQTKIFYQKHGLNVLIFARFIPIVRSFAPLTAAMSDIPYSRFLIKNFIGAILWVVTEFSLGFFLSEIPFFQENLTLVMMIISFLLIILTFIIEKIVDYIKVRRL